MGATVLNRARIGANCLVGAGALVTEGKEFPDNSLIVGAPARAIRVLDEATIAEFARIGAALCRELEAVLERTEADRLIRAGSAYRLAVVVGVPMVGDVMPPRDTQVSALWLSRLMNT